jgi:hypothetical protein
VVVFFNGTWIPWPQIRGFKYQLVGARFVEDTSAPFFYEFFGAMTQPTLAKWIPWNPMKSPFLLAKSRNIPILSKQLRNSQRNSQRFLKVERARDPCSACSAWSEVGWQAVGGSVGSTSGDSKMRKAGHWNIDMCGI